MGIFLSGVLALFSVWLLFNHPMTLIGIVFFGFMFTLFREMF